MFIALLFNRAMFKVFSALELCRNGRTDCLAVLSFFIQKGDAEVMPSNCLLYVYITSALLYLQLLFEAREDANNIKMD